MAVVIGQHDRISGRFYERPKPFLAGAQRLLDMFGADGQALDRYGTAEDRLQLLRIVGFREVGEGALRQRADRVFRRGVSRQDNDGKSRVQLHHHLEDGKAIQVRQLDIEERGAVLRPLGVVQGLIAGGRAVNHVAFMR